MNLNLDSNRINALANGTFDAMGELRVLTVMDSEIPAIADGMFAHQTKLMKLFLGKQFISELTDETFRGLGQLRALMLNVNRLTTLRASWFRHSPLLMVLGVRLNNLRDMNLSHPGALQNLMELWLRGNNIQRIPMDQFANLPKLVNLEMDSNPSDCHVEAGEVSCRCAAGLTGPVSRTCGNVKTHTACLDDACISEPLAASDALPACLGDKVAGVMPTCWISDGMVHRSNICKCMMHAVNCIAIGLREMPPGIPDDTAQLFLFMNEFTVFPDVRHLKSLYLLDVRGNKITTIPPASEVLPPSFGPVSTNIDYAFGMDNLTAGHWLPPMMTIAASEHTYVPRKVVTNGVEVMEPASFSGEYAFGGLGLVGNPSKCRVVYPKDGRASFDCVYVC